MEKPDEDHNTTIHHFSHHHHPLIQTNSQANKDATCFGCRLDLLPGKDYFRCQSCSFYLHETCYNMPRKTHHSSHPSHSLTLLVGPSSAWDDTLKCQACGQHIAGFYYNCAECDIRYHILCSIMSRTISISSHPHALHLELSPPYAFECDICTKPCYDGWLYRCQLCEFDTHLTCGISNIDDQASELIQLVSLGAARANNEEQISPEIPQNGKLDSHEKEKLGKTGPDSTEPSSNPSVLTPDTIKFSPFSGELSMTPSCQFSDACFSIDLAKSYSSYNSINPSSMETNRYRNDVMLDRITSNLGPSKEELYHGKEPGSFNLHPESKIKEAFLAELGNDNLEEKNKKKKIKAIDSRGSLSTKELISSRSDTVSSTVKS